MIVLFFFNSCFTQHPNYEEILSVKVPSLYPCVWRTRAPVIFMLKMCWVKLIQEVCSVMSKCSTELYLTVLRFITHPQCFLL